MPYMKTYKNDAPPYLLEFLNYTATVKGRSENTIISYYYDLKKYLRFLRMRTGGASLDFEEIKISDISAEIVKNTGLNDVLEFLHFISSERENSAKSRARCATALRQFYNYLTHYKMWFSANPLERLEMPSLKKPLPKYLSLEQAKLLLLMASETAKITDVRDFCILTLFLNCGLRLSELVGLNLHDYRRERDFDTDEVTRALRVTGKGSKERVIYLNNASAAALDRYLEHRAEILAASKNASTGEKAIFISRLGRRITNRRVEQIVNATMQKADLDGLGFSPHKLRHTAATLMFQNGVDVRVLKEVLGHENLGTTQIYTHVANKQIKEAMEKNPLSEL
ncbi:MAG: tyrosine-type recombinase/integrase [Oscillospiraceae bacterium]|nr:tyrosine-type recombinase/integrase [Oscillospiraceae bacterium]